MDLSPASFQRSFFLEWTNRTGQHDWLGLFASWTGIVCVILVAEGRRVTTSFGAVNSAIYLVLALNKNFYGEVLTTLLFLHHATDRSLCLAL